MNLFELFGTIAIQNTKANKEIDETTGKARNLSKELDNTSGSAVTAGKNVGEKSTLGTGIVWLGIAAFEVTKKILGLATSLGKIGFAYNKEMESNLTTMTALLGGNEEAAASLLEQLRELGAVTPMGTSGLVKNASMLLGTQKIDAEDMVDTLRMLGDVAKGDQDTLDGLVKAYSQAMSAGWLNAEDLNQMVDREVPIWQMVADYMQIEQETLRAMVKKRSVPADALTGALKQATSEGGTYYKMMEKQAETYEGRLSTLKDTGEMTVGSLTQAFFEMAKSDVLPRMTKSIEAVYTWAGEHQDTLDGIAKVFGNIAAVSFDTMLEVFTWLVEHGTLVSTALLGIASAMGYMFAVGHPLAATITALVAAITLLIAKSDDLTEGDIFSAYSDEDLKKLQNWIDAVNEAREAEAVYTESYNRGENNVPLMTAWLAAQDRRDELKKEVDAVKGLESAYNAWRNAQPENNGKDLYLDIPLRVAEDAETDLQDEMDDMDLSTVVKLLVDDSAVTNYNPPTYSQFLAQQLKTTSTRAPLYGALVNGSHASGLDYVPYDGYIAELHRGESILTRAQADEWRGGETTRRLEAMFAQMISLMQQMVNQGNPQIVLDTGVLAGQLAPRIDAHLGALTTRKERRNG